MITPFKLTGRYVSLEPLRLELAPELALAAAEDRSSYAFTWVPNGLAECQDYVRTANADESTGRVLSWAVRRREDGKLVGSTRYLDMDVLDGAGTLPSDTKPPTVLEIGSTWYAASGQRSAVNTETKLLLLSQAFDHWATERVTLKTDARNRASRAAIERLGALDEGVRRVHMLAVDGTFRDSAYYSIVRREWPAIKDRLVSRLS